MDKFLSGMLAGVIFMIALLGVMDQNPRSYAEALQPLFESVGETYHTVSSIRRVLNPCITDGVLPEICTKFIKNGAMTQPPIKIVIDESKIK